MSETAAVPATIRKRAKSTHVITKPGLQKIDVAKALKLRLQGNTLDEIGKVFGCNKQAVHQALDKFKQFVGMAEEGQLTAYSEHRADLFNAVEMHLTASLLDGDAMAKASLNNRAYAFKQIHEARRLESGQSTVNTSISLLGSLIVQAEARAVPDASNTQPASNDASKP